MARQIIDLPLIEGADISKDDFILVRDISERRDKRARVGDISGNLPNIVDLVHPIGSVVEFVNDVDPNSAIGGVWNSLGVVKDRRVISNRVIQFSHAALGLQPGGQYFLGSYGYDFLDYMLRDKDGVKMDIPSGWHVEYKMSAEISTSGGVNVALFINNIRTEYSKTWSGDTFHLTVSTDYFSRDDVKLQNTLNYPQQKGINFGYATDSAAQTVIRIYLPTLTAFLVRNKDSHMWERVS